ncbi:MAG TPA: YCF48-related protein [Candidatus Kapabacteria bacterium]|nr:YCF48-related protein [Candidatus Kapabacteria bacterium]
MKQFGIVLFFVLIAATASAQLNVWRSQNPPTVAGNLKAVQMISQYTTYVVGEATTFIAVSDSGRRWAIHFGINPDQYKRYLNLNALSFIDSTTGMTVGVGLVLKTSDAGNTWESLPITKTQLTYNGVLMISEKIAIVVGNAGLLMKTVDGGKTWAEFPLELGIDLKSIKKVRDNFITVTGEEGYLLTSVDSGAHWIKKKFHYDNTVNSVAFENEKKAVAVGEGGYVVTTTDQGDSWTPIAWDTMGFIVSNKLNSVDTKAPGYYVAVGNYQTLVYTSDGGAHWKKGDLDIFLTTGLDLNGIWMWDKNYGYAVGNIGSLLRTTDGGAHWDFIPQDPLFARMYGIAFPKGDTSNGIAVGTAGTVLITSDGGTHWNTVSSTTIRDSNLYCVTFADSNTAYACGEWGKIYKSTDFGNTWNIQHTPTTHDLHSISFINADTGWATGDRNTLLKTTTAGASWVPFTLGKDPDSVTNVSFCDKMNGLVSLNHTTDGGISWKIIKKHDSLPEHWPYFEKSKMISPSHYIVTASADNTIRIYGTISTYIGDSIYLFGDPITTYFIRFTSVDFADELHGTVVGTNGIIYQTDDGGRSWHLEYCPTNLQFEAVSTPQAYVTSASGIRGIILRRSNTDPLASVSEASTNSTFEIISAYPNPARDVTKIVIRLSRMMPLEIRLYTELGAEVLTDNLGMMPDGEFEVPLEVSSLSSGTYILEIRSSQEAKHFKVKIVK